MRVSEIFFKGLKQGWIFIPAVAVILLSFVFASNPELTEAVYSRSFYPTITSILTFLFAWLPFSLTEVILLALIFSAIATLVACFRKKLRFRRWLFRVASVLSLILAWFYFAWGFNYFRQPLIQNIGLEPTPIDSTVFRRIVENIIEEANSAHVDIENISELDIHQQIEKSYEHVKKTLAIELPPGRRAPKNLFFNIYLTKVLVSGFFSPFFHEIHLNSDLLPFEYASTLAHEKAHQMGIANEAEASFLGYLACLESSDPAIVYSAKFEMLQKFLGRARMTFSDYDSLQKKISDDVREDLIASYEHWSRHIGVMSEISRQAYDQYLKANRISEGIQNYSGVVEMTALWKLRREREASVNSE